MIIILPEYESLSPTEIAKRMGVTLEAVRQARRRALGLCRYCKSQALAGMTLCEAHRTQRTASDRTRKGAQPWKPGGRGRPPKQIE